MIKLYQKVDTGILKILIFPRAIRYDTIYRYQIDILIYRSITSTLPAAITLPRTVISSNSAVRMTTPTCRRHRNTNVKQATR